MSPLELLEALNAFYDQAFNRLLAITFGTIAFIGVLVPVVVGWVQLRSLRQEKDSILAELKQEVNRERDQIKQAIEENVRLEMRGLHKELEARMEALSRKLEISTALAEARSFHLQALNSVKAKEPHNAVHSLTSATASYIDAGNEANAQRCLSIIIDACLPATDRSQYAAMKMEQHCSALVQKLNKHNHNQRYENYIQKIEREMGKASTRDVVHAAAESDA